MHYTRTRRIPAQHHVRHASRALTARQKGDGDDGALARTHQSGEEGVRWCKALRRIGDGGWKGLKKFKWIGVLGWREGEMCVGASRARWREGFACSRDRGWERIRRMGMEGQWMYGGCSALE